MLHATVATSPRPPLRGFRRRRSSAAIHALLLSYLSGTTDVTAIEVIGIGVIVIVVAAPEEVRLLLLFRPHWLLLTAKKKGIVAFKFDGFD
ncbi:uncharacterized protein DS421_14g464640 [Arachis hypogaea]|nr:uncharacterized protein DS421_14g464640 [Arachis hypogaea]